MSTPPLSENGTPWNQLPGATGGIRRNLTRPPANPMQQLEKVFLSPFARIAAELTGGDPEDWDTIEEIIDNIVGAIPAAADFIGNLLSGVIPIGLLAPTVPNLLANGAFDGAVSIVEGDGWVYDPDVGRTSPGAARYDCTGVAGMQLSTPVQVAEGQKVAASVYAKWAGVAAGSGAGIRLVARWYNGESLVSTSEVGAVVAPAAAGGWSKLSGEMSTPSGVETVCLALVVDAGVSAGQVWWDDASLTKPTASLPQQWIAGLVDDLGEFLTMLDQFASIVAGGAVTAINGVVQAFKDGWAAAQSITTNIAGNITSAVSGGIAVGEGIVKDVFDTIANIFGLAGTAREIAMSAQTQLQEITNNGQTPEGFDGYTWSTIFSGADGASLPSGDWPLSAGLAIRGDQGHVGISESQGLGHWWARAAGAFVSDTQSTSVVLGPRGRYGQDWDTGLYLRVDDAMTVGAFARVRSNRIDIGRFTRSGTTWNHFQFTQIATQVREGDLVRFRATGDTYHVLVNGIVRASYTDGSASIAKGAAYRRAGFSQQRNEYYAFPFTYRDDSYRVAAFAMADWAPPGATVTTPGWRLRRGSGNEVALSVNHGEQAPMPAGFYNVSDLGVGVTVSDLGTGQVTITTAGWYEIAATGVHHDNEAYTLGGATNTSAHVTNAWHASPWVLYVDGAAVAGPLMAGVSTTIYLDVGQVVRPGVSASSPIMPAAVTTKIDGSGGSNVVYAMQGRSRITGVSGAPSASFTGRKVG
ncbi:hypothetical protein [Gordonia sihwensis]|uniref:hypothetical protein n=1 Tax=Gordonia sihwensis TaxID=173559 RepID=UPI001C92C447|nr:hypothetical protein [Gordonia sihwensis]